MGKIVNEKNIISVFLLTGLIVVAIKSHSYQYIGELITATKNEVCSENVEETALEVAAEEQNLKISTVTTDFTSSLWGKQNLVDLNGWISQKLGMRDFYKNNGGVVLKNGYIAGIYPYTSTEYEVSQMKLLKEYLDQCGIQLLYVNEPVKYLKDSDVTEDLGLVSYSNQNADTFLSGLDNAGITYLALREKIVEEKKDSYEMFYRTDHHWTVPSGKWAAEKIVDELNAEYGYDIDKALYQDENFYYTEYEDAWLGEQGKKLGKAYVGLDDFCEIEPVYDTDYTLYKGESKTDGSFADALIAKSIYLPENNTDIYSAPSWHYSYIPNMSGSKIVNHNIESGRVLVLGDSYSQVMVPFLSLGASRVDTLVLRAWDGNLKQYITDNSYDTVIVAYAQFMIGAHDNETSANYEMFHFFK